jgi:hypothetical protein
VLTLGEIEQGISRIRGRGDNEQAAGLERWLREVELGFADKDSAHHAAGRRRLGGASSMCSRFPSLTG